MVEEKWVCEDCEDYEGVRAVSSIATARMRDTVRMGGYGRVEEVVMGGGSGGEGGPRAHTSARRASFGDDSSQSRARQPLSLAD